MQGPLPLVQDLVLIGGGHAHALVLRMWGMDPLPGVRLTVINPGPVAPYTGMLPGHIAGHYAREDLMIDLVRLARFAGARVILDRAVGIDREAKRVILGRRDPIGYDVASIDVGIASDLPQLAGGEHAVAAKPLGAYAEMWQSFVARRLPQPKLVVIGAGTGGVELAMASAFRLKAEGAAPEVVLLERGEAALPGLGEGARAALLARLESLGVRLMTGAEPARVEAERVVLADGRELASDFTLSVAGAQPQGWLRATGLALHEGFVSVGPELQTSDPAIFAAGDCAHLSHAPRPKAGVFAVREAPILLHNLRAALSGGRMRRYRPQRDYLKLISCGGKVAVADKFGKRLEGRWLWQLKDRIDRKFMEKFASYPAMTPDLPEVAATGLREALGAKPLCGGCGAKVGAGDLSAALSHLPAPVRGDVVWGRGDDAAVLRQGDGFQVLTTDHLRAFTHDAALMARITAVHATGDIWAMGAAPQAALAQITLPRMAPRMQADLLREIMEAASEVFSAAGADVLGGHTSVGAELTLGFTVTGLAERIIAKGGARPGDALVLTKALGTGVVLAAEMAGQPAPGLLLGEVVEQTYRRMVRPLGPAASILAPEAHAMTDVTGFGLAGHLLEMLEASGCAAELDLASVPLLPGAERLSAAGHGSSLLPANRASALGRVRLTDSPRAALLFDPQTAGGLLAAVPAQAAERLVAELRALGEPAAVIGRVSEGAPILTVTG
ncbi:selenide, water dikinase SelD [Cereibacter changlensis JA139]|uniref:Selenide, water dikinase SelD n=2 Tax=Cereibacter changlensis TaxID=402884 RepID=A0A2T4JXD5_9RHOB|nr:selenide, water dikinase SelD [Cereibacter changlensis]PTE22555.1 selenide, water dikinase SelD [Cereibacter changlensis JA139]PZX50778.1 selenide,water dikinase [Cereibacter changlensis]